MQVGLAVKMVRPVRGKGSGMRGQPTGRYLLVIGLGFLAVLSIDWMLYLIGSFCPKVRLDPDSWGTYGDWAAAILPAAAIVASVDLWVRDDQRRRNEHEKAQRESDCRLLRRVRLEESNGAAWLNNPSDCPLTLDSSENQKLVVLAIQPRDRRMISMDPLDKVSFRALDRTWELRLGERPEIRSIPS